MEIADKQMFKVKFNFSRKIQLKEKEQKSVPLIVIYQPSLTCQSKIVREKIYLLHTNDEIKQVLFTKLMSFRSAKKLSNYLVRAKHGLLYNMAGHVALRGKN